MVFEPIYRIITGTDTQKLLSDLESASSGNGEMIEWVIGSQRGQVKIDLQDSELAIGALQRFLDAWLSENAGEIDYIHDDDALICLAQENCSVGFFMPTIDKDQMFSYVVSGSILPRKAFSLGHAAEKRYYLEGRKII